MNQQLTQAEIDALLKGQAGSEEELLVEHYLTPLEQDAIGEIGNIAMGAAATNLSLLISKKVQITTPSVSMILSKQKEQYQRPLSACRLISARGWKGKRFDHPGSGRGSDLPADDGFFWGSA